MSEVPTPKHSVSCQYLYTLARLGLSDSHPLRVIFWDAMDSLEWDVAADWYIDPAVNVDCPACYEANHNHPAQSELIQRLQEAEAIAPIPCSVKLEVIDGVLSLRWDFHEGDSDKCFYISCEIDVDDLMDRQRWDELLDKSRRTLARAVATKSSTENKQHYHLDQDNGADMDTMNKAEKIALEIDADQLVDQDSGAATDTMTDAEKMALAQFCKRVSWKEMRINALDSDEAYLIRDAIEKLQRSLADEGFAPR